MAKASTNKVKMECSICYDSLADEPPAPTAPKRGRKPDPNNPKNTSVLVSLPCGHIYHRICIEEWLVTKQSTCPCCRKKCEKRALKAVFLPTAGVTSVSSGSSAQTGSDDDGDDDDDDDDEKGKGPCGKCEKLAKQVEELKKEKEELQKQVAVDYKQVQSLQKMVDDLTADQYTFLPPANGPQNKAADENADIADPSDEDDDEEWSFWPL